MSRLGMVAGPYPSPTTTFCPWALVTYEMKPEVSGKRPMDKGWKPGDSGERPEDRTQKPDDRQPRGNEKRKPW